MKTIDLGEKESTVMPSPSKSQEPRVWYPTVHFSDKGQEGQSSFDSADLNKVITVTAKIKLTAIRSDENKDKPKKFEYTFEVHKIEMPDDLSKQEDSLKGTQVDRAKKRGMA